MNTSKGMPILGALLGGLGALVLILILAFGAIVPPTQFVVWGLLGLGIIVGSRMLAVTAKSARFITILVVAIAMLVWSAVGLPAHFANGDLNGGCTLAGTSSDTGGLPLDAATPQQTSVADPFVVDPAGSIEWSGSTPGAFEGWRAWLAVDVGGFVFHVWDGGHGNSGLDPDEGGVIDVGSQINDFENTTHLRIAGIVHLFGNISSQDGACDMDAYLEVPSDGLFSGPVLIASWVILAIIAIVLIALMVPVCRVRKGLAAAASPLGGAAGAGAATAKALDGADATDRATGDSGEAAEATGTAAPGAPPTATRGNDDASTAKAPGGEGPRTGAPAKNRAPRKTPPKEG